MYAVGRAHWDGDSSRVVIISVRVVTWWTNWSPDRSPSEAWNSSDGCMHRTPISKTSSPFRDLPASRLCGLGTLTVPDNYPFIGFGVCVGIWSETRWWHDG